MKPKIGFIGLGIMGHHMSKHLLDAGYELVYDSSGSRIRRKGGELMQQWSINLPEKPQSELIVYHRIRE